MMSKYMTPVLVLVLAVLAITLAYKGSAVITAFAPYQDVQRTYSVTTGQVDPIIRTITCYDEDDSTDVDLDDFNYTIVTCNATVFDEEGCDDYNTSTAIGEFYAAGQSAQCGINDHNDCYNNATCEWKGTCSSLTNQTVECKWSVWYAANNSTWTGYINISDSGGLWDNGTDTIPVQNLNALNITNNSLLLGVYAPNTDSSTHPNSTEIENGGNIRIDTHINGSTQFVCNVGQNFDVGNLTYDLASGTAYSGGTAVLGGASQAALSTFDLDPDTSGGATPTAPSKALYWGIGIPTGTSGGAVCNATIMISAKMDGT